MREDTPPILLVYSWSRLGNSIVCQQSVLIDDRPGNSSSSSVWTSVTGNVMNRKKAVYSIN